MYSCIYKQKKVAAMGVNKCCYFLILLSLMNIICKKKDYAEYTRSKHIVFFMPKSYKKILNCFYILFLIAIDATNVKIKKTVCMKIPINYVSIVLSCYFT